MKDKQQKSWWPLKIASVFEILGWIILVGIILRVGDGLYEVLRPKTIFDNVLNFEVKEQKFLSLLVYVITSSAEAGFCFIISRIFKTVFGQYELDFDKMQKLVSSTTVAYIILGVVKFYSSFLFLMSAKFDGLYSTFSYSITLLMALIPILTGLTIYFLYQKFSQMLKFQNEVV